MLRTIATSYEHLTTVLFCGEEEDGQLKVKSLGTAFFFGNEGYLLTCAHLFKPSDRLFIECNIAGNSFQNLSKNQFACIAVSLKQFDAINDVALLKLVDPSIFATSMTYDGYHDESLVQRGSSVAYLGYPFVDRGLNVQHIAGAFVSAKVISATGTHQFQIDAMVHEGCSGGPCVDVATQKIIGIVNGRFSPTGTGAGLFISGVAVGRDSTISYVTSIKYGLALLKSEGVIS